MPDGGSYRDLIEDVYINSIRSVLIVDDDYPTISEIISGTSDEEKRWCANPEPIINLINGLREKQWLIDIHDGKNEKPEVASHLHQSDLLVLDFELDRKKADDGDLAVSILHRLSLNPHFNLVVVHTQTDLDHAYEQILLSFLNPLVLPREALNNGESLLIDKADDLDQELGFFEEKIGLPQYLKFLECDLKVGGQLTIEDPIFGEFVAALKESKRQNLIQILQYCIAQYQKRKSEMFGTGVSSKNVRWSQIGGSKKWLRMDNLFVAFSDKSARDDLIEKLLTALADWRPLPSRLILSKIRKELETNGVKAEDEALIDADLYAIWYKDLLLKEDEASRGAAIQQTLRRHSTNLMRAIEEPVAAFANEMVQCEALGEHSADYVVKKRYGMDLSDENVAKKAASSHNTYVCSHDPSGWHLTTGHILNFNENLWICLSPACDLVPGQKTGGHYRDYIGYMPFVAVRLYKCGTRELTSRDIQSSRFLFLKLTDKTEIYSFNDPTDDNSNPHWYMLYAKNGGKFDPGTKKLTVFQGRTSIDGDSLTFADFPAEAVKQLHPEYAINLMQKLGITMTRVGLDFVG